MSNFAVGDVLAGKYEIKAVLGAGGMGTVYRARQIDLHRDVAIKVPNPQALEIPGFLARFAREARLVGRLVHDNIVQVFEYQESQDAVYIVMEFVEGQDLKSLVNRPPADLTVRDVATILQCSCEGLAHAHEAGIVHRDIKPHNIMVQQRGRGKWRVKIMDFGIAHMDANQGATMLGGEQLTVTGQAIGTPSYMSPEQIRGSGVVTQSDIYSFGCVIYYTFTRQTPFQGTGFTVAAAHLSDPAPTIRSRVPVLPEALDSLIRRCLEKDPANRPQDASDLGQELFAALTPLFDRPMSEVWPPLESSVPVSTAQDPTRKVDGTPPALAKGNGFDAPTMPEPAGSTVAVPRNAGSGPPARREPTGTAPTATLTEPTIAYNEPIKPAPTPSAAPLPTPNQPDVRRSSPTSLVAAIVAFLLIAGVSIGFVIKNKLSGPPPGQSVVGVVEAKPSDHGSSGNGAGIIPTAQPTTTPIPTELAQAVPTSSGMIPLEPTPVPALETPAPVVRETPTPAPTPTPDPVVERLATLDALLEQAVDRSDLVRLWQRAMTGYTELKDTRLLNKADAIALSIAKAPPVYTVEAGRYSMGSAPNEGDPEERPRHNVQLDAYAIGRFEVSALEFATFLNTLPAATRESAYKRTDKLNITFDEATGRYLPREGRAMHPANGITWDMAVKYAEWLSAETGERYRLPTEAEWEVAARAGLSGRFPWGNNEPDSRQANFNNSSGGTLNLDDLLAGRNPWGLAHMAGNVAEWCSDWYSERVYEEPNRTNPRGPADANPGEGRPRRVVRGGSYASFTPDDIRNARRNRLEPDRANADLGFRLVKEVR